MKPRVTIVLAIVIVCLLAFREYLPQDTLLLVPILVFSAHVLGLSRRATFSLFRLFVLMTLVAVFCLLYRLLGLLDAVMLVMPSLPIVMSFNEPREERAKLWWIAALGYGAYAYVQIVSRWRD